MVNVMMGLKGSGKTKKLLKMVEEAVESEDGDIVFIEATSKLIHDIPQKVRLIDASQYDFSGYDFLKGYMTGLYCANYDITHVFIDNLLKITCTELSGDVDSFLKWCESFGKKEDVKFTITISEDIAEATETVKKYLTTT